MSKGKVISIQGDEILNKLLVSEISNEDIEVFEVDNGRDGLLAIRDQKPVLVILDILVTGLDGLSLLRELKSSDDTKGIPVIVVSILSGEEDIQKCIDLGAEEYIVKSQHSMLDIVGRVKYHLSSK